MTLKYLKLTLFFLIFFTGIPSSAKSQKKEKNLISIFQKESPAYLYCYSTLNGQDGLHLIYSHDGIVWRLINHGNTVLKPTLGTSGTMTEKPRPTMKKPGIVKTGLRIRTSKKPAKAIILA